MNYYIKQLPDDRWGIYLQLNLLATIGNYKTAEKILDLLQKNN